MSFGFGVGDIIQIAQLTRSLVDRIRHAPALFRELEGDLTLTQTVLSQLSFNWTDFSQRILAATASVNWQQGDALRATLTGVQTGLRELEHELDVHGQEMGASTIPFRGSLRFTRRVQDLRHRLQFHMASLHLVMQNVTLMQGRAIAETLQTIHEAQVELRREVDDQMPQGDRGRSRPTSRELRYEESLRSFRETYLALGSGQMASESSPRNATSTASSSLDYIMRRWLDELDAQGAGARIPLIPECNEGTTPAVGQQPRPESPESFTQGSTTVPYTGSAARSEPSRLEAERRMPSPAALSGSTHVETTNPITSFSPITEVVSSSIPERKLKRIRILEVVLGVLLLTCGVLSILAVAFADWSLVFPYLIAQGPYLATFSLSRDSELTRYTQSTSLMGNTRNPAIPIAILFCVLGQHVLVLFPYKWLARKGLCSCYIDPEQPGNQDNQLNCRKITSIWLGVSAIAFSILLAIFCILGIVDSSKPYQSFMVAIIVAEFCIL